MWSLNKTQIFLVLTYSAIFPITNLIGGMIMSVGLFISTPFLPLAWIGGMIMVGITKTENSYLFGAFLTIFIQVWLVTIIYLSVKKKKNAK